MDTVLILKKETGNLRRLYLKKSRFLNQNESCTLEMVPVDNHTVRFKIREDISRYTETQLPNLEVLILAIIKEGETMAFADLSAALEGVMGNLNQNSIKNTLKRLMDREEVCMTDGKSWENVTRYASEKEAL